MWIVEEWRRGAWVGICRSLPEAEAQGAMRTLRGERPWRAYRVVKAEEAA